jgi:hypothetical protein
MATIDITASMETSRYGETDQWVSRTSYLADSPERAATTVELRCHAKYTRRTERFTVLYQGPGGAMRLEQGGPQVTGPVGCLIAQATVISAHPANTHVKVIDVKPGDVLVINGQRMAIVDDRPRTNYPRLVSEVEAGLLAAYGVIRAQLADSFKRQPGTVEDNARSNERQAVLTNLGKAVMDLAPILREHYASPVTR